MFLLNIFMFVIIAGFLSDTTNSGCELKVVADKVPANTKIQPEIKLNTSEVLDLPVVAFDKNACVAAIQTGTNYLLPEGRVPSMLSIERKINARDTMMKAVLDHSLQGHWIETGVWKGGTSLIAAYVQRVALQTPACGKVQRRAIWLADSYEGLPPEASTEVEGYSKKMDPPGSLSFDGGLETVKKLFTENSFHVDGTGDVPIYFVKGYFNDTLPDATIKDIAVLRLDGDLYSSTLQALFALYRKVRVGGYVIIDDYGHSPQCKRATDEFFVDANITLNYIDYTGRYFQKLNSAVRIPPDYNTQFVQIHERVKKNWEILAQWHAETVRAFTGNVAFNNYESFRFGEALLHLISLEKERVSAGEKPRINVCETGFNGGHSAMLFLAFSEETIDLHYYGWDLGQFGSARPIAEKMKAAYQDKFHIFWGDSKQTMKNLTVTLEGQLCHLMIVDGEHSEAGVEHDIRNFLTVAKKGTSIIFADDCSSEPTRSVPQAAELKSAWDSFVKRGEVISIAEYRNPQLLSPGFVEGLIPQSHGYYEIIV